MNMGTYIKCHNGTSTFGFSSSPFAFLWGHSALRSPSEAWLLICLRHAHPQTNVAAGDAAGEQKTAGGKQDGERGDTSGTDVKKKFKKRALTK